MPTDLTPRAVTADLDVAIEQALIAGDLSKLTPAQRLSYYNHVCQSLDLNPLTRPFRYLTLNGELQLYALKNCTDQLRAKRGVSLTIVGREMVEDCYVVTSRATLADRQDESIGAVTIAGLKGEARANALMKCETKSKRRVTLSICGLGMLDESEVESIPGAVILPTTIGPAPPTTVLDTSTGELVPIAERPTAPLGYDYLESVVQDKGGWWQVGWRGAVYKTKRPQIGQVAEQSYQDGVPVKLESRKGPWLDAVHVYRPTPEGVTDQVTLPPADESEVPF